MTGTNDVIDFEILEDGTIKCITPGISGVNHRSADELLSLVSKLAGGKTTIESTGKHGHAHVHTSNKVSHSH